MAQLNVRLRPELKARGDSVLELYGISSTDLIRALWSKVSLGEQALVQVLEVLAREPATGASAAEPAPVTQGPTAAESIRQRQLAFAREVGLDPASYRPVDDETLEDLVYQDYLEERAAAHVD